MHAQESGAPKYPVKSPKPLPTFKKDIKDQKAAKERRTRELAADFPNLGDGKEKRMQEVDSIEKLFAIMDESGEGILDIAELKRFFRDISPVISSARLGVYLTIIE